MKTVIKSSFDDLRRNKALVEKRDLSLRRVAEETGLSFNTIQRIRKGSLERVYVSTLDTLCQYFEVKSISQLIEYHPDEAGIH